MISSFRYYSLCCRVNISAITHASVTEVTELFEIEDVKLEIEIEEVLEKKVATEEIKKEIPYEVTYIYDDSLEKGMEKVTKEGINGSVTYQYAYEYDNDVLVRNQRKKYLESNLSITRL